MFNGLDELEDFAVQLAPLTPDELAALNKKKAAVAAERAVPQAEVSEAQPVLASEPEPEQLPKATTRPYARYVVVGGLLVLGLVALVL
jgi:hypothetical protein